MLQDTASCAPNAAVLLCGDPNKNGLKVAVFMLSVVANLG